ncbi:MAG: hypothetical protein ACI861_001373 [Paracoccaceae bacterium]|jgi:hypothetical protein
MRIFISVLMILILPVMVVAQDDPLAEYVWLKRPLVIFADSENDPRFRLQMEMLAELPEELEARDVVVLFDTDPAADSPLRQTLHPRDFMLILFSKDGKIALRKPTPWTVRELSASIDKMSIRIDELESE